VLRPELSFVGVSVPPLPRKRVFTLALGAALCAVSAAAIPSAVSGTVRPAPFPPGPVRWHAGLSTYRDVIYEGRQR
jgi:hypothetical protein